MSDLRPQGTKIQMGGQEYGLRFTLNAIDDIQDHFDIPISELGALMNDERNVFKNLRYLITMLVNEDVACQNDGGAQLEPVTERYVGRHLTSDNLRSMMTAVMSAFASGAPEPKEDADPNAPSG